MPRSTILCTMHRKYTCWCTMLPYCRRTALRNETIQTTGTGRTFPTCNCDAWAANYTTCYIVSILQLPRSMDLPL